MKVVYSICCGVDVHKTFLVTTIITSQGITPQRMILTAIYHMFVTGEMFNPSDLYKVDMPQEMVDKQKEKAIKQAAKLLISLGLIKATDISVA